jgi:hypothetical protein
MDPQVYEMIKNIYNKLKDKDGVDKLSEREFIWMTTKLEDIVEFFADPKPETIEGPPARDDRPWYQRWFG